jgi:multicomponent K+:H+ antiporter subunit D
VNHLPILPVLVPLLWGALLLLVERRGLVVQRALSWTGLVILLAVSALLVVRADGDAIDVYLVGDWPARLGIALVADRLSALMVLTTTLLAMPCLLYACAGWDRRALHFHALFQLQLAGLNGAFLTGDLFNLFVFFEVMLIASYGLLLSGGRGGRIRAGLHYVVVNITASTLFLIALALLYGMTGTLNMAEMSLRVAAADPSDIALIQAASGILLVVFCVKAALLPLYLWLPDAYARSPAAVAALFTIMTKVGLYAILRVYTLIFGSDAGLLTDWAWDWLLPAGIATLALAALGVLAAPTLRLQAAYLVIVSAATLFVAFAMATPAAIAAGLFYLVHSTFIVGALFLLVDLIRRQRGVLGDRLDDCAAMGSKGVLGALFVVAAISVSGLPPLSGFLGKMLILQSAPSADTGAVWAVILITSLMTIVALARSGSQVFWREDVAPEPIALPPPPSRAALLAVVVLLVYGGAIAVAPAPLLRYAKATAGQLLAPSIYLESVRQTAPLDRAPSP